MVKCEGTPLEGEGHIKTRETLCTVNSLYLDFSRDLGELFEIEKVLDKENITK